MSIPLTGNDPAGTMKTALSPSPIAINKVVKINSKEQLDQYLQEYKQNEKKQRALTENEMNNTMNSSFLLYGNSTSHQSDLAQLLHRNVYQVATKDLGEETSSSSNKNEDVKTCSLSSSSVNKIWQKRNVSPTQLFQVKSLNLC